MNRVMIFIDLENFEISKSNYIKQLRKTDPNIPNLRIDYQKIALNLTFHLSSENSLLKTFIFAPKPDDFLMQDNQQSEKYHWVSSLNNVNYLTVIEGKHIARPAKGLSRADMDISKPDTYYIVEKGTDVNLTTHLLTKGFMDSYDKAIILSGDTDYIPVIDILNTLGKVTVVAGIENQNLNVFKQHADAILSLNYNFLQKSSR